MEASEARKISEENSGGYLIPLINDILVNIEDIASHGGYELTYVLRTEEVALSGVVQHKLEEKGYNVFAPSGHGGSLLEISWFN